MIRSITRKTTIIEVPILAISKLKTLCKKNTFFDQGRLRSSVIKNCTCQC